MANKEFGNKLRALRNKAGYTQSQVADILNLKNPSTVGSWEIGKSEPNADTFLKLCKLYGVEDILLEFTGKSLKGESDSYASALDAYNRLNVLGKLKAEEYMQDLSEQYKYTKDIQSDKEQIYEGMQIAAFGGGVKGRAKKEILHT